MISCNDSLDHRGNICSGDHRKTNFHLRRIRRKLSSFELFCVSLEAGRFKVIGASIACVVVLLIIVDT
jgi:hypothetical protein